MIKSVNARRKLNLRSAVRDTWRMEWSEFDERRAMRCLPAVAIPLIAGLILNKPVDGLLAAAGAFAVGFGSFQSLYRSRLAPMVLASIGIALSAFAGTIAGHSDIGIAVAAGVWAFLAGLAMAMGPGAAYIGLQCIIFLLIATGFPVSLKAAATLAELVLGGGLLQTIIITSLRMIFQFFTQRRADLSSVGLVRGAELALHTLRRTVARRTSVFRFAVRLGATLAISAAASRLLHNPHSYWLPMTVAIVLRPDFHETFTKAVSRVGGTLLGAGLSTMIAATARPTSAELVILVVVFAWLSYSFIRVNYAIGAVCITSYIVFLLSLVGLPEMAVVTMRIGYTSLGAGIALLAYAYRPPRA